MSDNELVLREAKKIVHSLGKMFAPFCEVVLHDLSTPKNSIIAIENNFSGRKIGDATTNIGLERITDNEFPDVIQNYQNTLPDGRIVKSTSIGIRNKENKYIASICLNFDITIFTNFNALITNFTALQTTVLPVQEQLRSASVEEINNVISSFAAENHTTPKNLDIEKKRLLIKKLHTSGFLRLKNAMSITADLLGVTRATIYNYQKSE